jgi:hypothetical protein
MPPLTQRSLEQDAAELPKEPEAEIAASAAIAAE